MKIWCLTVAIVFTLVGVANAGLIKDKPSPCDICKMVVESIKIAKQLANSTIEDVEKMIREDVCPTLPPSQKAICEKVVDDIEAIVDMIEKDLDVSDICQKLGLCPKSALKEKVPVRSLKDDKACKICHLVVETVDKLLEGANATVHEITEIVRGFCELNPEFKSECNEIVSKVDKIVADILAGLSPDEICHKFGLCPSVSQTALKKYSPCKTCTMVVSLIDTALKYTNATVQDVEELVKNICKLFPDPSSKCSQILDQVEVVIDMILKGISPDGICEKIGICPKVLASTANRGCPTCGHLVQIVQMGVAYNVPRENMKKTINYVCGLHSKHREFLQCIKFADHVDEVIEMLATGKSSGQICEVQGRCSAREVGEMLVRFKKQSSNGACEMCKTIVSDVANFMKEGEANLKVLEEGVMEICSMIGEKEAECKEIADEVFKSVETLINLIIAEADPETICKSLAHVCP